VHDDGAVKVVVSGGKDEMVGRDVVVPRPASATPAILVTDTVETDETIEV
jgi:hypothetical protein